MWTIEHTTIKLKLTRWLDDRLSEASRLSGLSKSDIVRRAVRFWMRRGCPKVGDYAKHKNTTKEGSTVIDARLTFQQVMKTEGRRGLIQKILSWYLDQMTPGKPRKPTLEKTSTGYIIKEIS